MIVVDEIIKEYIARSSRHFSARLCMEDGSVVSGTIRSMNISKGSCSNYSFQPQATFSNSVSIIIDNCTDYLKGKKLAVQIGASIDGTEYWYTIATVYAVKAPKKGKRTTLEGQGAISAKLGRKGIDGSYSTVGDLIDAISSVAGVNIYVDDIYLYGLEDMSLPSGTINYDDYYMRELLGFIAGLGFGYVTETTSGDIVIRSYKYTDGTIASSPSRLRMDPDFHDIVKPIGIEVTGLDDQQFITGDLQNVSLTNPLMTQLIFETYKYNFLDIEYQPYDMDLTLGDFTIEPTDLVTFTDRSGESHTLRCMSIRHSFTGGLKTTLKAPTLNSGEDYSRGVVQKEAGFSYNAIVSGNLPGGGWVPAPTAAVYPVEGDGVYGHLLIENGTRVYGMLHIEVHEGDIVMSGTVGNGSASQQALLSADVLTDEDGYTTRYSSKLLTIPYNGTLSPIYAYELNGLHATIPAFTYNGTEFVGAGALSAHVNLSLGGSERILQYYINFSTDYLMEQLGELYIYDSATWNYKSLIGASFDLQFTYLTSGAYDFTDSATEKPNL